MPITESAGATALLVSPFSESANAVAVDDKTEIQKRFSAANSTLTTVAFICHSAAIDIATQLLMLPNSPAALTFFGLPKSMSARWPLFLGGLSNNKKISGLNINHSVIDAKGIAALVDVLPALPALRTLEMRSLGGLTAATMQAFAPRITALSTVDLSNNAIGNAGANLITRTIATSQQSCLRVLIMNQCEIGDDAMKGFRDVLAMNTLNILDLAGNLITDKGVSVLAPALQSAQLLQVLDLTFNRTAEAGEQALIAAVRNGHQSLTSLLIGNENIDLIDESSGNVVTQKQCLKEETDYRQKWSLEYEPQINAAFAHKDILSLLNNDLWQMVKSFLVPVASPPVVDIADWRDYGFSCREVVTDYRLEQKNQYVQRALNLRARSGEKDWQYRRTAIKAVYIYDRMPFQSFTAAPLEMMMELGLAGNSAIADQVDTSPPTSASTTPRSGSSGASAGIGSSQSSLESHVSNSESDGAEKEDSKADSKSPDAIWKEKYDKFLAVCNADVYKLAGKYQLEKDQKNLPDDKIKLLAKFKLAEEKLFKAELPKIRITQLTPGTVDLFFSEYVEIWRKKGKTFNAVVTMYAKAAESRGKRSQADFNKENYLNGAYQLFMSDEKNQRLDADKNLTIDEYCTVLRNAGVYGFGEKTPKQVFENSILEGMRAAQSARDAKTQTAEGEAVFQAYTAKLKLGSGSPIASPKTPSGGATAAAATTPHANMVSSLSGARPPLHHAGNKPKQSPPPPPPSPSTATAAAVLSPQQTKGFNMLFNGF